MKPGNVLTPQGREVIVEVPERLRDNADPLRTYYVTVDEAQRLLKASTNRWYFIEAGWDCLAIDQSDAGDYRKVYPISDNVQVSKSQAMRFMEKAFNERVRDKVHVRVTLSSRCLFVGA